MAGILESSLTLNLLKKFDIWLMNPLASFDFIRMCYVCMELILLLRKYTHNDVQ